MDNAQATPEDITLFTGAKMPAVGFGCYLIPKEQTEDCVYNAIKAGYRLIDEAPVYENEVEAGKGIKKAIDEGIIKREDLFVTSKLWCTNKRKEHVRPALMRTLKDLDLEYLDLFLIHFPITCKYVDPEKFYPPMFHSFEGDEMKFVEDKVPLHETWAVLEELVAEGLVKHIGISNMMVATIRELQTYAKVQPAACQVEIHPYFAQPRLVRFCKEQNIAVTAYSCLGSAAYVEQGLKKPEDSVMLDPVVKIIAEIQGKSPAQIVLRWAVQRGTAVIPKSMKEERIKQNLDLFSFTLTEEQMKQMDGINRNERINNPGEWMEVFFGKFYPIFD